ncbi:Outer membrane cobalamin receptor protein, SusC/RagA family [Bacteroidales bacterium Barb6XT]|nr:Outer membrane cobalamin receptor protein, SusC/RagA family [Bacteroidales bacterium Barb6XT]
MMIINMLHTLHSASLHVGLKSFAPKGHPANGFRKYWLLLVVVAFSLTASAQQGGGTIKGSILDSRTNEPVAGASVVLVKEKTGTVSDLTGAFSVTAKAFPVTLLINYLGYKIQELDIYEYSEPITVFLNEDLNLLNEVVVVAYGTQKRKEITGSVASVSQVVLSQAKSSFDNVLGGTVPGVHVTQSSGQPGATSSVRIRGSNSITGGNEPLYVIDGFVVYNDNNFSSTGSTSGKGTSKSDAGLNVLATINPADIESIEILKDASATAIYGTRGANGVVLITSKKGTKGTNRIHLQTSTGWQNANKTLDLLNGSEWASLYNDILASQGKPASFDVNKVDSYDWQSEALRKGKVQDYQLSFSGGDEKTRYAVSGGYFTQDGIVLNTDFKRYAFRINLDRELSKRFRIGVNAIGSAATQNGLSALNDNNNRVNTWFSVLRTPPVLPIYGNDGGYNYANPYTEEVIRGITPNAIGDLVNTISETKTGRILGNFYAEYTIIPSLKAKVNVGADVLNTKQNYFAPFTTWGGFKTDGFASVGAKLVNSWQAEFTLNYEKQLSKNHSIGALAGYTTQRTDVESAQAIATNFLNDKTTFNSLQSASTSALPYSDAATSIVKSYLGRVNYSYLDRYHLTTTLRADGSSRFGPNNHWAYFPSIGVSWNVNEEAFLRDFTTLSNLQWRLSTGTVGNQEIGDYMYEGRYIPANYSFAGVIATGYVSANKANKDLKWEKTTQYNTGIDIGLWKNRLALTFDAYYKKTTDLLIDLPLEAASGFVFGLDNVGSVENKGIEIGLTGRVIENKNIKWTSTFNWSLNRNKVLDLGSAPSFFPEFSDNGSLLTINPLIVKEGEPLGTFYGWVFDGIVQKGEDLTKIPVPGFGSYANGAVHEGDPKYKEKEGAVDGKVDNGDKVVLGSTQPDFIFGFNNTVALKNWDLSVFLQGSYGNELYNAAANKAELTTLVYNAPANIKDRWTPEHPSNTVPRTISASNFYMDSRYIENASYIKLRSLTLGYTVPLQKVTKTKSSVRLFFSAQNLFTITKYSGYDPEASRNGSNEQSGLLQGVDFGAYPASKSYSFGFEINL